MNPRDCFSIRARFGELLDESLSAADVKYMEEHLRSCCECRREKQSYTRGVHWVRSLPGQKLRDGFAFSVLATNRSRMRIERSVRTVLSAAAVIFVVFLAGPGESLHGGHMMQAVHQPQMRVDYIDASSMQPVELDYALHRALATNRGLRLTPVVRSLDEHRRKVVEAAAFAELQKDLDRFGAAASDVEIEQPIEMDTGSFSPFVVAVDTYSR